MMPNIEKLIANVPLGGSWGCIASRLILVRNGNELRDLGLSFSQFISLLARRRGKTPSTYWRLVRAGDVFQSLSASVSPAGNSWEFLSNGAVACSPESLEIYDKISRVAPPKVLAAIGPGVLGGLIPRQDLRGLWETYRPILNGKTSRGRSPVRPTFEIDGQAAQDAVAIANNVSALLMTGPEWLNLSRRPYSYEVFRIPVETVCVRQLNAVAALATSSSEPLQLHGFQTQDTHLNFLYNSKFSESEESYAELGVDFLWLVLPPNDDDPEYAEHTYRFGILEAKELLVKQVHAAKLLAANSDLRLLLLSELLKEATHVRFVEGKS
jgi:hypothetical protein